MVFRNQIVGATCVPAIDVSLLASHLNGQKLCVHVYTFVYTCICISLGKVFKISWQGGWGEGAPSQTY